MNAAKTQSIVTFRQKLLGLVLIVMVFGLLWQAYGMFSSNKPAATPAIKLAQASPNTMPGTPSAGPQPTQSALPPSDQMASSQNERDLVALQQETQAGYIKALNELQILKVYKDIAEANQAIMAARSSTVDSEKKIVDALAPQAPEQVAQAGAGPGGPGAPGKAAMPLPTYQVVSVSEVQNRWTAVVSNSNLLYSVTVGDTLPTDGSRVVAIDRSGVTMVLHGVSTKYSLVPII